MLTVVIVAALMVPVGATAQVVLASQFDDRSPSQAIVMLDPGRVWGDPDATRTARIDHAAELYRDRVAPVVIVVITAAAVADTTISQPVPATCWVPVVDAPIIDPFRPPACPWCAGNRGVECGADAGAVVRAPTPGTVVFAGAVADSLMKTALTGPV